MGKVERNVLLEMLILESKGLLKLTPSEIIEKCCGWGEGVCDEELEFRKYVETYDQFLINYEQYTMEHLYEFGVIPIFEDLDNLINDDGYGFKRAVIKVIKDRITIIKIPLAEPPYDILKDEIKENIKNNPGYMSKLLFDGKIVWNNYNFEIVNG